MHYTTTHLTFFLLGVLCLASLALMLHGALTDAAIMDELAHIPAGYGYVRHLDFRLNPEHPPLVKVLAGLPLLLLQPVFPTDHPAWRDTINGQWDMGRAFLYESGNDADAILFLSRLGPILLTLFLIILSYLWSKELIGKAWALLPAFLLAFSPHLIAHGHYVTTDVAAAFGIVLGTYAYFRFLFGPSRKNLLYAGLAFGIAQLTKYSAVLLVPYFVLMTTVFLALEIRAKWHLTDRSRRLRHFFSKTATSFGSLVLIGSIGLLFIVYPVYALFTANYPIEKQAADTETILYSFADGPTPAGEICKPMRCFANLTIVMSGNALTRPLAEYLLGLLMVLQRSAGGNTGYFLGEVSAAGWHHYFPVVYLLKEPIPVLLLILIAIGVSMRGMVRAILKRRTRFVAYLQTNFAEFSMLLFVILYWAWSIQSPLNIGFRHLFPVLPFTYILTASALKRWVAGLLFEKPSSYFQLLHLRLQSIIGSFLKAGFVSLMVFWLLIETLVATPFLLSYFNEFAGGTSRGYRFVTDSNYDWGQDMRQLRLWANAHPEADTIAVDYFGGGNPQYYLGNRAEGWWSSRGNPKDHGIRWLAVSVNTLQGAQGNAASNFNRQPEDEYRWLSELRPIPLGFGNVSPPDARAGTSIFIYEL